MTEGYALSGRKPGFESRYRYQIFRIPQKTKEIETKSTCRKPRLGFHRTGKRWPSSSTVLAFSTRACLHTSMSASSREEELPKLDGELRPGTHEGIVAACSSIGPRDFLTDSWSAPSQGFGSPAFCKAPWLLGGEWFDFQRSSAATKEYIYVPFCSCNDNFTTTKNIYILFCR